MAPHSVNRSTGRRIDASVGHRVLTPRKWPPSTQRAPFASLEASAPRCMGQRLWKLSLRNTARDGYYSDSKHKKKSWDLINTCGGNSIDLVASDPTERLPPHADLLAPPMQPSSQPAMQSRPRAITQQPIMPTAPLMQRDGVTLAEQDGVYTLTMGRGENRINPEMVALLSEALDLVEAAAAPKSLLVSSSDPKFFCNGLDIEWMGSHPTEVMGMLESFWQWLGRLLTMDCHTVASISGHAFGAGAFLVLSCDYRLMRTGRGFLNFPEAALGMRLQKQFAEVAKAKLPPATLRTAMLEASRVGAADALASGWVDAVFPIEHLASSAPGCDTIYK